MRRIAALGLPPRVLVGLVPVGLALVVLAASSCRDAGGGSPSDPLPSWAATPVREAVLDWLAAVTDESGPDHIPAAERIAVFDNDGTSWCERPRGASSSFQIDLARSLVGPGDARADSLPLSAWFSGDRDALRAYGWREAYIGLSDVFAGMPVTAYRDSARAWLARSRDERFGVPLTGLAYRPMLELMRLLQDNGFQVWIVTGSNQDFVRSFAPQVYGIPPGQVIGSWTMPVYRRGEDGTATVVRGTGQFDDGYERKPANIETRIGRRPVFAAGNSTNDEPMCRYAVTGGRRGLALAIRHDDDAREYAYGRPGALDDLVADHPAAFAVSMKEDWTRMFVADVGDATPEISEAAETGR